VQLQLTRPEARNALSLEMCEGIQKCVADVSREDSNARVILLTGDELSFSAGKDLKASLSHTPQDAAEYFSATLGAVKALLSVPIPIVVGMEKICLGLGLELALTGDIRVAGESTQIGFPEINLSLFPGCGGVVLLPLILGNMTHASDMILTGRRLSASEAHNIGLISRVVPVGTAESTALSIATELCEKNRNLLVKTKIVLKFDFHDKLKNTEWMNVSREYRSELGKSEEHLSALEKFISRNRTSN